MTATILIVEDEQHLRELLCFALRESGYQILEAVNHEQTLAQLVHIIPDLILLDWHLPDDSSLALTRQLQQQAPDCPIMVLTEQADQKARILSLGPRVDVYLTQPFSTHELLARIRATLRPSAAEDRHARLRFGELVLDNNSYQVMVGAQPLHLRPTEFRLLALFMANPDHAYSRHELLTQVWGRTTDVDERTVDVYIRRLRKALQPYGHHQLIQSVRGIGYRFSDRRTRQTATDQTVAKT
jgi:two-component system phosphate regulon response regulator PhoB